MPPRFINVDLELQAPVPLEPLIAALGDAVFVMPREAAPGRHWVGFELGGAWCAREAPAERIVVEMCALIEALPHAARAVWDACDRRDFDLGFESAAGGGRSLDTRLTAATVARVAALGGAIAITIYPLYERVVDRRARGRHRRRRAVVKRA